VLTRRRLAGEQRPFGAFPFDAFLGKVRRALFCTHALRPPSTLSLAVSVRCLSVLACVSRPAAQTTPLDALPNAKDMEAMKLAEIKNGRLAMMAITGFAVQEVVWGKPVVDQTPFFFGK
jgi:hypothetical protein